MNLTEEQKAENRKALLQVINEGNEAQNFIQTSPFYRILKRTLVAQREAYKQDCYDASKDKTKNVDNFLGRMEALDWVMTLIDDDFIKRGAEAFQVKVLEESKEKEEKGLDQDVHDDVENPVYPGETPGFV